MRASWIIATTALVLAGCASFPDANGGRQPLRTAQLAPTTPLGWTYDLGDRGFAAYLQRADLGSLDVKAALARAAAADAALRVARAEGWPSLTLQGGASRAVPNHGPSTALLDANLSARWIPDLWGEVRASAAAAGADARAAGLEGEAARAVLAAEAARGWLALAAIEDGLVRDDRRRQLEIEGLALSTRRVAAGHAGREEILERRTNLARLEDDRLTLEGEAMLARQRLLALAGLSGDLDLPSPSPLAALSPFRPGELNSASLENRPDVRASAARLEAADARRLAAIREARPKLVLATALQGEDSALIGLLQRSNLSLLLGVRLEGAILDGGRSRARADKVAAEAAEAEVGYLRAVVEAESELAAALSMVASAEGRQQPAAEAVRNAQERLTLTKARLAAGASGRIDQIEAERAVVEAEEGRAAARRALIESSITTQAALTGGARGARETAP